MKKKKKFTGFFNGVRHISDNFQIFEKSELKIGTDKPIYIGHSVLDSDNILIYEFY